MGKILVSFLALAVSGCTESAGARATEQLAALQKKKAEQALTKKEERADAGSVDTVRLNPPYDETQATLIAAEGPCPEGFWALFPGEAPGATPEEKAANNAKRKEIASALRAQKYLVKLRGAKEVVLSPYDAPSGKLTVDVIGTIDCLDDFGRVAVAWTTPKAIDPGSSAAKQGSELRQNMWTAQPTHFEIPMASFAEAKAFTDSNRLGLSARVGFGLGAVEIDKKMIRVGKVSEKVANEELAFGGGMEDWGAGRLVKAEVLGLRVAAEREKKVLFEQGASK